jgi:hypothetical protein
MVTVFHLAADGNTKAERHLMLTSAGMQFDLPISNDGVNMVQKERTSWL